MIGVFAVLGAYGVVASVKDKLCSGASAFKGMLMKKKNCPQKSEAAERTE